MKGIHDCSSQSHGIGCMLRQHSFSLRRPPHYRYGGAVLKENIVDFKYKGISEDKINEIQVKYMPKFEIPVLNIDVMKKYAIPISNSIDEFVKSDLRNKDIYIICEMAKLYLKSLGAEECCENCVYHDDFTWVCFNPEADDRADFTDESHACDCWKAKGENMSREEAYSTMLDYISSVGGIGTEYWTHKDADKMRECLRILMFEDDDFDGA